MERLKFKRKMWKEYLQLNSKYQTDLRLLLNYDTKKIGGLALFQTNSKHIASLPNLKVYLLTVYHKMG